MNEKLLRRRAFGTLQGYFFEPFDPTDITSASRPEWWEPFDLLASMKAIISFPSPLLSCIMDPELEEAEDESKSARESGPFLTDSLRRDIPVT